MARKHVGAPPPKPAPHKPVAPTPAGTPEDDILSGGAGRDQLSGRAGADQLNGLGGDDRLSGGDGDDVLSGGDGHDRLDGDRGDDVLIGSRGRDSLDGGQGADRLDAGAGSDRVKAGAGDDLVVHRMGENVGARDDYDGGSGQDTLLLEFTHAEWMARGVQADLARFVGHLDGGRNKPFDFSALGLKAKGFEAVWVTVDGVELTARDDPADARDDAFSTTTNAVVSGQVLTNDIVPDLVRGVSLVSAPEKGQLALNPDGSFTYDPTGAFTLPPHGSATVSFWYRVTDADGDRDVATAVITVTNPNRAPVADDDAVTLAEDSGPFTFGVLGNDSDPDGDALTIAGVVQGPAHGKLVVNPDGTLRYTPNADYAGADAFTYRVADGYGGEATAQVAITVTPVNDAPIAGEDQGTLAEDSGTLTLAVLADDSDVDGDPLTISSIVRQPERGSVTINPDGTIGYTPDGDYNGSDSFRYRVSDGQGGTAEAEVTLTVTPVNDAPVARADSGHETVSGVPLTLTAAGLLGNDTDLEGDPLSLASVASGAEGTVALVGGAVVFTPVAGFTGPASFTYVVTDGTALSAPATVSVTVKPPNSAPVFVAGESAVTRTLAEAFDSLSDAPFTQGHIAWADADLTDTHSVTVVGQGGQGYLGTFSIDTVSQGADRAYWRFSLPAAEFNALSAGQLIVQTYDLKVSDGRGGEFVQTATVTLKGGPDRAVITSGTEQITRFVTEAAGVPEPGAVQTVTGTISYTDVDLLDTHGLQVTRRTGPFQEGDFDFSVDQDADTITWTYTIEEAKLDGLASFDEHIAWFELRVSDSGGAVAPAPPGAPLTLLVRVKGTNDVPVFTGGTVSGALTELADRSDGENTRSQVLTGRIDYTDPDGFDPGYSASFTAQGSGYLGSFQIMTADPTGTVWRYSVSDLTLDSLAAGETLTQLYDVTIREDGAVVGVRTITVTLTGANDAPTRTSLSPRLLAEDATTTGSALAAVIDTDGDPLIIAAVEGSAANVGAAVAGLWGTLTVGENGAYTYAANRGEDIPLGALRFESFDLQASDGQGGLTDFTLEFRVEGVEGFVA